MKTTAHTCFGWEVVHVCLAPGEALSIVVPKDTLRDQLSNITLYTVGRLSAKRKSGDFPLPDRTAGFFSHTDLPATLPRGTNILTAEEPCEWWCFDVLRNDNSDPGITPIVLEAGQTRPLQPGDNILVCQGSVKIGDQAFEKASAFTVASEGKVLVAETAAFALRFGAVKTA